MRDTVTVALPVRDGARYLGETLASVRRQQIDRPVEILVADSGSRDGSVQIAHRNGAEVIRLPLGSFSHGGTRNLLMERSSGSHVAFLTQDAVPAGPHWLARMLEGFELAERVGLVFGPYRPRPQASATVRRELSEFFAALAPTGEPRIDRADPGGPAPNHPDIATFFTDANGCVAREAWERVPFRDVPYAEDQLLAVEMRRAGYAKVFQPDAAVLHSHDYPPLALFRRYFDEFRGLHEVYGWVEPARPRRTLGRVRREVRRDVAFVRAENGATARAAMLGSLRHHTIRAAGSLIGSRADRLPPALRRACSLERRGSFEPYPHPPSVGAELAAHA